MIAYHCDANLILADPFSSRKDTHQLLAYDKIMQIMGHLFQKRQGVRSTKSKLTATSSPEPKLPQVRSNELHIHVTSISKFYTDNIGRFPIHACSGNQYIMIAYHCNANLMMCNLIWVDRKSVV